MKKIKLFLLLIFLTFVQTIGVIQASPVEVQASGNIRLRDGKAIEVMSKRYELTIAQNGLIMALNAGGIALFTNIGPFVRLSGYQGVLTLKPWDKPEKTIRRIKHGFRIEFKGTKNLYDKKTLKSVPVMDYAISIEALDNGTVTDSCTLIPINKDKVEYLFLNADISDSFAGANLSLGGKKNIKLPTDWPKKYRHLAGGYDFFEFSLPAKKFKGGARVGFPTTGKAQLGQYPGKYSIQFKPGIPVDSILTPGKPIKMSMRFKIPEATVVISGRERFKVKIEKGEAIRKLHKGLFSVGSSRFNSPGKAKINNFVENHKEVALIKEAGIPALRFNLLYPILGIRDGWTRRKPYRIDPVYPYDGGPIDFRAADEQMVALRRKLGGPELSLVMGAYNPSWMKTLPGTKLEFHAVTDDKAWGRFAEKVARHAKENNWGVKIWEIWNEPDAKNSWEGGTFADYIKFYRTIVPYIKRGDPGAKIAGPVLTSGHFDKGELLDKFLAGIKGVPCDYLDWHHYGKLDEIIPRIRVVKALLAKYNRKHTGLFISEVGPSDEAPGDDISSAVWLARAWKRILYNGVDYATVWHLAGPFGGGGGLLIDSNDWTPTPAFYLFKMMNTLARMYESELVVPPRVPEGLESIAVENRDSYSIFFIKTGPVRKIRVAIDFSALGKVKPELYSLTRESKGRRLRDIHYAKDGSIDYAFKGKEVLLLKLVK